MNELQIFNNPQFGEIRAARIDEKPYFVGIDVARMLKYAKPSQAVIDHCKGIRKLGIPSDGGIQETNMIPEGDVYRLIIKAADQSKSPDIKAKAEGMESWIFDEVVPSVIKTGQYSQISTSQLSPELQMFNTIFQSVAKMEIERKQLTERMDKTEQTITIVKETFAWRDDNWRKQVNCLINKASRGSKDYQEKRNESYRLLEERAGCDLAVRLRNLKARLENEGATKTRIAQANKLDVIEADKRLKEIYTNIVKEMALAYTM